MPLEGAGSQGNYGRFFKRGPVDVVRRLLDIRDRLPTDFVPDVALSVEMRALRSWEEFDEGIIRWCLTAFIAAVAGNLGAVMLTVNGAGPNFTAADAVPKGTIFTVDEIMNVSAGQSIRCRIGSLQTGLISVAPADYTDARWGPGLAIPPIRAVTGSNATASGEEIEHILALQRIQRDGIFIGQAEQAAEPLGGNNTLTCWGVTANTGVDVRIFGRIILPR
jgi:hypothetical protein